MVTDRLLRYNQGRSHISKLWCPSFLPPFLLPFLYPSVPPSLLPNPLSFPPFLHQPPSLPTFLFKFLSQFLSFVHASLFFGFVGGPPPATWSQLGVWGESCKPGRQTVSVHSGVKTGFWWAETAVLKRFAYNERQFQVTRDQNLGCWTLQPLSLIHISEPTRPY